MRAAVRQVVLGGACPEAKAVFAAMTTPPTGERRKVIDKLIRSLKSAGVWSKLKCLFVLAAADEQAARVDWKLPSRVATAVASPAFSADRGFTSSATAYLNTGYIPLGSITVADFAVGVYERTNLASSAYAIGANSGPGEIEVTPRNGSNFVAGRLQYTTLGALSAVSITDSRGLTVAQRDGVNSEVYKNGVAHAAQALAGSPIATAPNFAIFIGARNNSGTVGSGRASELSLAFVSDGMTDAENLDLYSAVQTYMTALGAQV